MKKFILGLFLTVGISGISFAGNIVNENNNFKELEFINTTVVFEKNNIEFKKEDKTFNLKMFLFSCRMQVIFDHYDSNGNYLGSTTDPWQESLCLGNPDGSDITVRATKIQKPQLTIDF